MKGAVEGQKEKRERKINDHLPKSRAIGKLRKYECNLYKLTFSRIINHTGNIFIPTIAIILL